MNLPVHIPTRLHVASHHLWVLFAFLRKHHWTTTPLQASETQSKQVERWLSLCFVLSWRRYCIEASSESYLKELPPKCHEMIKGTFVQNSFLPDCSETVINIFDCKYFRVYSPRYGFTRKSPRQCCWLQTRAMLIKIWQHSAADMVRSSAFFLFAKPVHTFDA